MAYDPTNPPRLVIACLGTEGGAVWLYKSADVHGDVDAAEYFSDGGDRGMKVGDVVIVVTTPSGATTIHSVTAVEPGGFHISNRFATVSPAVLA